MKRLIAFVLLLTLSVPAFGWNEKGTWSLPVSPGSS